MKIFTAVAETGSMTGSARRLGMTQSAVSQAIVRLEEQIGTQLIDRSRRPLRLTPAGDVLLAGSTELAAAAATLREQVRAAGEGRLSNFRVGLVDSFAATAGPPLIRALRRHADRISVWSGITPNLLDDLMADRLDLIIVTETRAPPGTAWRRLLTEPFLMVLPAALAERAPAPRIADLARNHPMVRYSIRSHIGLQVEKILKDNGAEAPRSLEFDGTDSVLPMVAAGLGWGVSTPLCMVHGRQHARNVALVPITDPAPTRTLSLVSKGKETDEVACVAETEIRTILQKMVAGPVRAMAPWAERQMTIHV